MLLDQPPVPFSPDSTRWDQVTYHRRSCLWVPLLLFSGLLSAGCSLEKALESTSGREGRRWGSWVSVWASGRPHSVITLSRELWSRDVPQQDLLSAFLVGLGCIAPCSSEYGLLCGQIQTLVIRKPKLPVWRDKRISWEELFSSHPGEVGFKALVPLLAITFAFQPGRW